jgi:hypothetical protein
MGGDVTPQGIRATPRPARPDHIVARDNADRDRRDHFRWSGFLSLPQCQRKVEKSIAVLPFRISAMKKRTLISPTAYGTISNQSLEIGDLKVISRMSVMSYRGDGSATRAKSESARVAPFWKGVSAELAITSSERAVNQRGQ